MTSNHYDLVPYGSYAYPRTQTTHLHTVGRLFSMEVPDYRTARVLEIGCASGGNIIPMAVRFPDSSYVGVDPSLGQIQDGQALIADLGLENIRLMAARVEDLSADLGTFDYILCHGVFSWVSEAVREAILAAIHRFLAPGGLALVSYNVLPGWGTVQTLREMMLFHCRAKVDPEEKVAQARALLRFIKDAQVNGNSAYALAVEHELAVLDANPDWYVFHDHLEAENTPFFFHQFIDMAARHDLGYVGDGDLTAMFLDNAPPPVVKALKGVGDPIQLEQYLDFACNRRFRSTILCHAGRAMSRSVNARLIRGFHLYPAFHQESAEGDRRLFSQNGTGKAFASSDGAAIAALRAMLEGVPPYTFAGLVEAAAKASGLSPSAIEAVLDAVLIQLVFAGLLQVDPEPPTHATTLASHPLSPALVRAQLRRANTVVNARHETIHLQPIVGRILSWLDGTRDRESIVDGVMELVDRGEFFVQEEGQPIADGARRRKAVAGVVDSLLGYMLGNALLAR